MHPKIHLINLGVGPIFLQLLHTLWFTKDPSLFNLMRTIDLRYKKTDIVSFLQKRKLKLREMK